MQRTNVVLDEKLVREGMKELGSSIPTVHPVNGHDFCNQIVSSPLR